MKESLHVGGGETTAPRLVGHSQSPLCLGGQQRGSTGQDHPEQDPPQLRKEGVSQPWLFFFQAFLFHRHLPVTFQRH